MAEPLIQKADLIVSRIEPDAQFLLHCVPSAAPELGIRTGVVLGNQMLRSEQIDGWHALHLAPDEWLLIGRRGAEPALLERFARVALPNSLVDVSERTLSVEISGSACECLINSGCPLDLTSSSFPAGACSRTLFGKVMIMLWRLPGRDGFRMQYGRSFDDYVTGLIALAAEDLLSPGSTS